jgi:hypothetical protein
MDKILEIREYLANKFNNECLADEILSFCVDVTCNFNDFINFASYPFMIRFPGLRVILQNEWRTQLNDCLSLKFICYLDFSSYIVDYEGAVAISEALKTNSTLQVIDLEENEIGDKGATAFAKALKTNTSLQEINLNDNRIGDEGAIAISEALKTNSTLRKINLGHNEIGVESAIAIAEALKTNSTLREIDLAGNKIGDKGAIIIAEAL